MTCGALSMFRPGYRVSSTGDLATATEWLAALEPDLVVLDSELAAPDVLAAWHRDQNLDPRRTVILGQASEVVAARASVILPEPVTLPMLMDAVRSVATGTGHPSNSGVSHERAMT